MVDLFIAFLAGVVVDEMFHAAISPWLIKKFPWFARFIRTKPVE